MKKVVFSSLVALILMQGLSYAKTFATVNGKQITEQDLASLMRAMPGVSYDQLPQEMKDQMINQAIERRLLIEQARKEKIQNSNEYEDALKSVEDDLLLEVWMRKQMSKIKVSDSEIKSFYDENKSRFIQPESVKARHILVANENEAKQIIAELKKAGKNILPKFEELAKAKSRDGSAQSGGDLGWFGRQQMVPEFAEAAFKLKKGTFSQTPVKTQFGYHVIYLEDKKSEHTLALKDTKTQIEQNIKIKKFQDNIKKEGENLRKEAKIQITQ